MHQQEERSSAFILMTCTFKFFYNCWKYVHYVINCYQIIQILEPYLEVFLEMYKVSSYTYMPVAVHSHHAMFEVQANLL